ncbi:L-rhamnose mutarotase [Halomonas litopenaei]|uniref:L-rhamnose mutarotase n=1 Tax=Halomonas litopenaei TaxID=2109328 RepID=A0ABX5IXM9_9GAMM|nr:MULTISPECIES: L-rhamnose mutarotase [Halomonas]PTL90640.1 L-rhamnose mutarotase [Halomonas sp. SYSU XM8]PTL94139.1 L-rhamnose mutarotase [Halomonas litopenaei]
MELKAFRMNLFPGQHQEYRRRHDALWPELGQALADAGVLDYRIFLDGDRHTLFAVMQLAEGHSVDNLPELPVVRRWWAHMADIMDTHPDDSPVVVDLEEVFAFVPGATS